MFLAIFCLDGQTIENIQSQYQQPMQSKSQKPKKENGASQRAFFTVWQKELQQMRQNDKNCNTPQKNWNQHSHEKYATS